MDSNRQIKMGAAISYFAIGFNIVIGLIYTPWMVDNIGQGNYGLYTMANSLISLFLVDFGISAAVTRFIAKYVAEGNQKRVNNFLGLIYKLYIIIDIIICAILIIMFFFLNQIYTKLTINEIKNLETIYIIVGAYNILTFPFVTLNGILNAYEKFVIVKACELFNKMLSVVLTVLVITYGGGVVALVMMQAISGIITLVLRFVAVKQKTPIKVNFLYFNRDMLGDIFGFSMWSTVTSVSQRFIINIVPSIIGALSGAAEAAVFGIACTIEGYFYTFANAINGFFMPKISRIQTEENKGDKLLDLMIKVGRIQFYVLGLIFLGFFVIGSDFVSWWMGETYHDAYLCALLLVFPSFLSYPQQIATTALIVENKVKEQAIINVLASIISCGLGSILIKEYGSIGAAIGISIAYIFRLVCVNVLYVKFLGIDLMTFLKKIFWAQGKYLLVVLIFSLIVDSIIVSGSGILQLIIKGGIIVLLYGLIMCCFAMNTTEKQLVLNLLKKFQKYFKENKDGK